MDRMSNVSCLTLSKKAKKYVFPEMFNKLFKETERPFQQCHYGGSIHTDSVSDVVT